MGSGFSLCGIKTAGGSTWAVTSI